MSGAPWLWVVIGVVAAVSVGCVFAAYACSWWGKDAALEASQLRRPGAPPAAPEPQMYQLPISPEVPEVPADGGTQPGAPPQWPELSPAVAAGPPGGQHTADAVPRQPPPPDSPPCRPPAHHSPAGEATPTPPPSPPALPQAASVGGPLPGLSSEDPAGEAVGPLQWAACSCCGMAERCAASCLGAGPLPPEDDCLPSLAAALARERDAKRPGGLLAELLPGLETGGGCAGAEELAAAAAAAHSLAPAAGGRAGALLLALWAADRGGADSVLGVGPTAGRRLSAASPRGVAAEGGVSSAPESPPATPAAPRALSHLWNTALARAAAGEDSGAAWAVLRRWAGALIAICASAPPFDAAEAAESLGRRASAPHAPPAEVQRLRRAAELCRAAAAAGTPLKAWHGVTRARPAHAAHWTNLREGARVCVPQLCSATLSRDEAVATLSGEGSVLFELAGVERAHRLWEVSSYPGEAELLLPVGARWECAGQPFGERHEYTVHGVPLHLLRRCTVGPDLAVGGSPGPQRRAHRLWEGVRITAVGGTAVGSPDELQRELALAPEDTVSLRVSWYHLLVPLRPAQGGPLEAADHRWRDALLRATADLREADGELRRLRGAALQRAPAPAPRTTVLAGDAGSRGDPYAASDACTSADATTPREEPREAPAPECAPKHVSTPRSGPASAPESSFGAMQSGAPNELELDGPSEGTARTLCSGEGATAEASLLAEEARARASRRRREESLSRPLRGPLVHPDLGRIDWGSVLAGADPSPPPPALPSAAGSPAAAAAYRVRSARAPCRGAPSLATSSGGARPAPPSPPAWASGLSSPSRSSPSLEILTPAAKRAEIVEIEAADL